MIKKLLNIRSRALASTTFSSQRAATFDTKNLETKDLHTAYRLPLHRLSDSQLRILLQKYSENQEESATLSRQEMIFKLQELITKDDQKMLRPRLLTNINIINPLDTAIDQPVRENVEIARTTVGPMKSTAPIVYESTRKALLLNNDNEELEVNEQVIKLFILKCLFRQMNL